MILSKKKIIFTFLSISILASVYTIISPKNYINENEILDWVRDYITVSIGNITEKYKKKYNVQTVVNGEDYKSQQQIFVDFLSKKMTIENSPNRGSLIIAANPCDKSYT